MKPEKLTDALGQLDDRFLAEAESIRGSGTSVRTGTGAHRRRITRCAALAASLFLIAAALFFFVKPSTEIEPVEPPPEEAQTSAAQNAPAGGEVKVYDFTAPTYLSDITLEAQYSVDNYAYFVDGALAKVFSPVTSGVRVFSPLNEYCGIAALAMLTDTSTRGEILSLSAEIDAQSMFRRSVNMLDRVSVDDGTDLVMLRRAMLFDFSYIEGNRPDFSRLESWASLLNALGFGGIGGTAGQSQYSVQWGGKYGLIEKGVNLTLPADTILSQRQAAFVRAGWLADVEKAGEGRFITYRGVEQSQSVGFLKAREVPLYEGEGYVAARIPLSTGGDLWLIRSSRPNQTFKKLLSQVNVTSLIQNPDQYASREATVGFPELGISSTVDLTSSLKALGMEEAFNVHHADFSSLYVYLEAGLTHTDFETDDWMDRAPLSDGTEDSVSLNSVELGYRLWMLYADLASHNETIERNYEKVRTLEAEIKKETDPARSDAKKEERDALLTQITYLRKRIGLVKEAVEELESRGIEPVTLEEFLALRESGEAVRSPGDRVERFCAVTGLEQSFTVSWDADGIDVGEYASRLTLSEPTGVFDPSDCAAVFDERFLFFVTGGDERIIILAGAVNSVR